jgi:hypothetical protein
MSDQVTKTCTVCKRELPESLFSMNGRGKRRSNCKICEKAKQQISFRHKSTEWRLLDGARQRARKKGISFDLSITDIKIPTHCPVLGIELKRGSGSVSLPSSPTLDRLLPYVGYTRDNVRVISMRANMLKNSATVEELEAVLNFLKHDTCHF